MQPVTELRTRLAAPQCKGAGVVNEPASTLTAYEDEGEVLGCSPYPLSSQRSMETDGCFVRVRRDAGRCHRVVNKA